MNSTIASMTRSCLHLILALALSVAAWAQVPAVNPAFPNSLTGTPGTLLFRQINLNRVTNIAYHNGLVYTHEVAAANPRRWRFTDINNPASFTNEAVGASVGNFSDHGTHGHYKIGDWLGGQFAANIRRQSAGVNVLQNLPGFTYIEATQPGDELTRMYYPWGLAFNWIEYRSVTGYAYLYRGGQLLSQWPALEQHGVAGNSILLGNLLFITSDESNMGILCYDISPVFATPSQPPVLLDKLSGPIGAYIVSPWQNYLILSRRDTSSVDIVDFSDPTDLRFVTSINVIGNASRDLGNGLGYIQCQDNFVFADRHKINMDTFQTVLELDEVGNNRPAGSVLGQLDTSQHLMPMGNLLVSGGYSHAGADGVGVWIHDSEPDRRAPYVGYHVPRPGQTNFPLGAPVSLLIHENLESFTIINGETVILRPVGGAAVAATVSFSYDDVLTITPTQYLLPDTTYEVQIVQGGIKDVAGNGIVGYSFSFSTGSAVAGGNASPVVTNFSAAPAPVAPMAQVTFNAAATDADGDALEYRFSFGEGTAVRDWSADPTATHAYAVPGHYGVKVQVRDVRSGAPLSTVSQTGTVSVLNPVPAVSPTRSSPIALSAQARRVWVVNPDNDSVSVLDADFQTLIAEWSLNTILGMAGSIDPRSIAIDGAGNAWIACRDADRLVILNPAGGLVESIVLPHGSAPMGVAMSPNGSTAFVTLESRGQLLRFNTGTRAQSGSLNLGPWPRAMAISADGARVLVTRFISTEEFGQVYDVDASAMTLTRIIPLHRDRSRDGSSSGRGVPNYVSSIAISPDGTYAYYTAVKANTQRGQFFNLGVGTNDPLDPDNTMRAIVGRINLTTNREPSIENVDSYRVDVDNSESPTSIIFTPAGDYFFVTLQGNNHFAVFDDLLLRTAPTSAAVKTTKGRFPTGMAPQGLVFDPATNRIFSADFLGRSVTVHDLSGFLAFGNRATNRVAISTLTTPDKLSPDVLLGKRIFYTAADASGLVDMPVMSQEGYISCASCHADGQHDGLAWDFTQRGEGFRNTTDLRGRGGVAHGNVHWTANFDEIQDFVLDVVNEFGGGEGLLPPGQTPNPPLGAPNAGRSTNLDALAAYVTSLNGDHVPRSPFRNADGSRTSAAIAGESVFALLNCASCHAGERFTDSAVGAGVLHDVGTQRTSSGDRLGGILTGLDTPTLVGLWSGAPYFHDGSAKTLDEVFRVAGGAIYQAENATRSGGAYLPGYPRLNEDSSMHGQMVFLSAGQTVTFSNVEGGTTTGQGDLELRWSTPYWVAPGSLTVTVNTVPHVVAMTRPFGTGQPGNHWQRIRIENVQLTAGPTNTIVVTTNSAQESGFDDMLVITPDDRLAATPHRQVLALSTTDRNNLTQYLLQLDAESTPPASNPTVNIIASAGQDAVSARPYAEFDVTFSDPVAGLTVEDFILGGTAGADLAHLTEVNPGLHYRVRLAGFTQSGTVTVRLPANAATALDDAAPTAESNTASITYAIAAGDDVAALSDEFEDPSTLGDWLRNEFEEGWNANKLETWDIDTTRPGHMRLMPRASTWYQNYTGAYAYKEVTGDFVATSRIQARRRNGLPGRPVATYSLAGIMVRTARPYDNAAPVPDPGPNVILPWPPPAQGQPNHYTTPWLPGTENYIFLSFGNADVVWGNVPNTWYCEVKTTINSDSQLYGVQSGIPAGSDIVTLQVVRSGSTFVLMRRHGDAGPWIIENRFVRNDMPQTLQLGITTYTDWGTTSGIDVFHHNRTANLGGAPDLVADAEYFRIRRPDPTITPAVLQSLPFTGQGGEPALLSGTAASSLLGDNANIAYAPTSNYHAWLASRLTGAQLVQPHLTSPQGDANGNGVPNLVEFVLGSSATVPLHVEMSGPSGNRTAHVMFTRDSSVRGVTLVIESTTDFITWMPLATSVNGGSPTGTAGIIEDDALLRNTEIQTPANGDTLFFRARVELSNPAGM